MAIYEAPSRYHAYLLRCWREQSGAELAGWRFSVEDPRTGTRQGFASWDALVDFLQAELCTTLDDNGNRPTGPGTEGVAPAVD